MVEDDDKKRTNNTFPDNETSEEAFNGLTELDNKTPLESRLKQIVLSLPERPGVYQYFNKEGTIIYVGKAVNLKRRVSSYFNKNHQHNLKTRILVSQICDLKYVVVDSEQDALLLENALIKKHQPKYNILLKDSKTYPWIVIKN